MSDEAEDGLIEQSDSLRARLARIAKDASEHDESLDHMLAGMTADTSPTGDPRCPICGGSGTFKEDRGLGAFETFPCPCTGCLDE